MPIVTYNRRCSGKVVRQSIVPREGNARIATIVKKIRAENQGRTLFCDCGDTLHGTHPAQSTQGEVLIPILNTLGLDAMTADWEFAYLGRLDLEIEGGRAADYRHQLIEVEANMKLAEYVTKDDVRRG